MCLWSGTACFLWLGIIWFCRGACGHFFSTLIRSLWWRILLNWKQRSRWSLPWSSTQMCGIFWIWCFMRLESGEISRDSVWTKIMCSWTGCLRRSLGNFRWNRSMDRNISASIKIKSVWPMRTWSRQCCQMNPRRFYCRRKRSRRDCGISWSGKRRRAVFWCGIPRLQSGDGTGSEITFIWPDICARSVEASFTWQFTRKAGNFRLRQKRGQSALPAFTVVKSAVACIRQDQSVCWWMGMYTKWTLSGMRLPMRIIRNFWDVLPDGMWIQNTMSMWTKKWQWRWNVQTHLRYRMRNRKLQNWSGICRKCQSRNCFTLCGKWKKDFIRTKV